MKVLWQDHTFVMKCTRNALCLIIEYRVLIRRHFNSYTSNFILSNIQRLQLHNDLQQVQ